MQILPALMTATAVLCGLPVLDLNRTDRPDPAPSGADAELIAMCNLFIATDDECEACWAAFDAALEAGDRAKAEAFDERHGVLCTTHCRLLERLMAVPPKTILGFVAVARIAKRLRAGYRPPEPRYNSDLLALHLVESLAALEGSR